MQITLNKAQTCCHAVPLAIWWIKYVDGVLVGYFNAYHESIFSILMQEVALVVGSIYLDKGAYAMKQVEFLGVTISHQGIFPQYYLSDKLSQL